MPSCATICPRKPWPSRSSPRPRAPGLDRASVDRERVVGHDQRRVDLDARAEAVAIDAHALGAVEREALRRELRIRDAAFPAGHLLREDAVAAGFAPRDQHALPELERALDGFVEPRLRALRDGEPIDDDLDGVPCGRLSRAGTSSESTISPFTRSRTKPARRVSASSSRCSPLRLTSSGASSTTRSPSELASSSAAICCAV